MDEGSETQHSWWRAAMRREDDRALHSPAGWDVTAKPDGPGSFVYQPPLPGFRTLFPAQLRFAHPFERDFARLLDFFRIRWSYEPTSFCLSLRADGTPAECFTPDFYLPDLQTYVELTSMRQRLVTRKHRKIRRLREQYPGVRIALLYRRDYQRLLEAWARQHPRQAVARERDAALTAGAGGFVRMLWPEAAVADRLDALAAALSDHLAGTERPLLLATGSGADLVAQELAGRLGVRGVAAEWDRVDLTQLPGLASPGAEYAGPAASRVRIRRAPTAEIAGRAVVLVSSVMSTGFTTGFLWRWLMRLGARSVEVCTLLDRRSARVCDVPVRFAGFEAPAELLVGFGLSLRPQYRHLRSIGALHEPNVTLPVPPLIMSRLAVATERE